VAIIRLQRDSDSAVATGVTVAWSVSPSVTSLVYPAKTVGREMPFGRDTRVVPINRYGPTGKGDLGIKLGIWTPLSKFALQIANCG